MTKQITFKYDERDFLKIWNTELDSIRYPDFKPGLYAAFSSAKLKSTRHAFDSIMIDDFSKAYSSIIAEVKRKEPPLEQENYDVPELELHQAQLSRILEEIYCRFVAKKKMPQPQAEALV